MMKHVFLTLALTTFSALGFAQDGHTEVHIVPPAVHPLEVQVRPTLPLDVTGSLNRSFAYVRMAVSDSQPTSNTQLLPGLGLGFRLERGSSAIDLSASYNRHDYTLADSFFFTVPKANYLYYFGDEGRNNSFYLGGGAAWGGIGTNDGTRFLGLIPNLTAGFEMNRNVKWRSFVQLDVSQAADLSLANFGTLPGPIAELSFGGGF
jgi:hypothetical protein